MKSFRFVLLCAAFIASLPLHAAQLNNLSTTAPTVGAPDVQSLNLGGSSANPSAVTPSPAPAPVRAAPSNHSLTPSSPAALPPSGVYQLDPAHASVVFKINHLDFSRYTGRFDKMEAVLSLNAKSPVDSSLEATVFPSSVDTNNPKLEEDLRGDKWLNVIAFPRASFISRTITLTGPASGKVTGNFTFLGQTHPLTLDVTLVGEGTNTFAGGKPTIGFSATGSFRRSDYGLTNLLPMVGDDVSLEIDAEFDKEE